MDAVAKKDEEEEEKLMMPTANGHLREDMGHILREGARLKLKMENANGLAEQSSPILKGLRELSWRQQHQFSKIYHLPILKDKLLLEVRQVEMGEVSGLGTGACVWPAAVVLAKYLEKACFLLDGSIKYKRCCELGCGVGLTGLVAAALGAKEVYLTDQAQILFLAEDNKTSFLTEALSVGLSLEADQIKVAEYNWGGEDDHLSPPFDLIIVSDCLLPRLYPIEPMVDALDKLSGPSTTILVSYEHRFFPDYDPRTRFGELLKAKGLEITRVIPQAEMDPEYYAEDIVVWEIQRIKLRN